MVLGERGHGTWGFLHGRTVRYLTERHEEARVEELRHERDGRVDAGRRAYREPLKMDGRAY